MAWAQSVGTPPLTLRVGETWEYEVIDLWRSEVVGVIRRVVASATDSELIVRTTEQDGTWYEERVDKSGKTSRPVPAHQPVTSDRNYTPVAFPLTVGSSWSTRELRFNRLSAVVYHTDWKCHVSGYETILVPAGSYATLRVNCAGWWSDRGSTGSATQVIWFAPDVNGVIRMRYVENKSGGSPWEQWEHRLTKHRSASAQ
jgi:hypothetical protein